MLKRITLPSYKKILKTKALYIIVPILVVLSIIIHKMYLPKNYVNDEFNFRIKILGKYEVSNEKYLKDGSYYVGFNYVPGRSPSYEVPVPSIFIYSDTNLGEKVKELKSKLGETREEDVVVDGIRGKKLVNKERGLTTTHVLVERNGFVYVFSVMPDSMLKSFHFLD